MTPFPTSAIPCAPCTAWPDTDHNCAQLYLLYAHYETPARALLLTVAIETLATYIPFRLLRPLSRAHAQPATVPNADILTDGPITLLTTLLAGAIYSVSLLFAYSTYLPTYLVVYFEGLPSLVRAHESSYVGLLPVTLALGFAARVSYLRRLKRQDVHPPMLRTRHLTLSKLA